jgi:hypothetical protein
MTTQRRKKAGARSQRVVELDDREKQIREDYRWVLHDRAIQRQHAGNVVAVHQRKIWGAGPNHSAALATALQCPNCPRQQELALVYVEGRAIA